jgi:predicted DCC family thiol-disulfide oxidoreductase YuxK
MTERNGGWVLYDGDCQLCRAWAGRSYRVLRRRGFKLAALQLPWVRAKFGLDADTLLTEMRLIMANGRSFGGAEALIEIARTIWWAWPITLLARFAGARQLMRRAYRWLARRRHCSSSACGLQGGRFDHCKQHSVTSAFYELP